MPRALTTAFLIASASSLAAQSWESTQAFQLPQSSLAITRPAQPRMPFTVAGSAGAIFGQGDGSFEVWDFPVKVASHFRITAELAAYPIPIELADYASTITVNPAYTTITYSHAAFTVKQHMFSGQSGPVIFFEIASVRPLTLTFRFTADMLRMWPAPNFGLPSAEWTPAGFYILHTDNEALAGAIGIPGALPGILAPYQERPRTYPVELKLSFNPKTQSNRFFPLLISTDKASLPDLNRAWPANFRQTVNYYSQFFDNRLTVDTPDPQFDLALRWAELSIDQARVNFHGETALAAGYYSSADSARPGFGWFFGRDTLFTLYAVNSYGDLSLSRNALEFLLRRQRADGKIMHEYSQSAPLVDWAATPYFYASADSTPLLLMTVWDYVQASADVDFVRQHWLELKKSYAFIRSHDSDGDGIYENTEGTGWVESWPSGMPHQEVYLAALDQQSCTAMAKLAALMDDPSLATQAKAQAATIAFKIATEYYDKDRRFYAFSRNANGTLDHTATAFPSVAWWDGTLQLPNSDHMFERWASPEFSTDWGVRDVSRNEGVYDPMSYHQGSVWPLYTGWTALAEYRAGRPYAGYDHLMQNAGMTFTQDAGAVTELLSGEFFQPFGRSSSHQLWSSAMVLTPALRGLFGIEIDRLHNMLRVNPQLPAAWDSAAVHNVAGVWDLKFRKARGRLEIEAVSQKQEMLCLTAGADCRPTLARIHRLEIPLPAFEVDLAPALPEPGSATRAPKIVSKSEDGFELEGQAGSETDLDVRFVRVPKKIAGASLASGKLHVTFPTGDGYVKSKVVFTW